MTTTLIAQLNYHTGNVVGNTEKLFSITSSAGKLGSDLVIFGRYAVCGLLEKDPVLAGDFFNLCLKGLSDLAAQVKGISVIVGSVLLDQGSLSEVIYLITPDQQLRELIRIPAFVSEESEKCAVFNISGLRVALLLQRTKQADTALPNSCHVPDNTDLLIVLGKSQHRCSEELAFLGTPTITAKTKTLIYLNMVGGYTSHVFSGGSIVSATHSTHKLALWKEDIMLLDLTGLETTARPASIKVPCSATSAYGNDDYEITPKTVTNYLKSNWKESAPEHSTASAHSSSAHEFTYQGLMLAIRDFIHKNSFAGAVLGLSGGIDSALVAAITTDAIGAENVHTFMLPTRYTSRSSIEDAKECAERLGIMHTVISIEETFCTCTHSLQSLLSAQNSSGVVEENIQSRIRGMFLMAVSNGTNLLLLATGNKSELLTGYMTLYGDTCGGFAPLKSIYKTKVYDLVNWRNHNIPYLSKCKKLDIVPTSVIDKPPSAELRFNQKDQDTLPEYDRLDRMLKLLLDERLSKEGVLHQGFTKEEVDLVEHLVKRSLFKLNQVAPGPIVY